MQRQQRQGGSDRAVAAAEAQVGVGRALVLRVRRPAKRAVLIAGCVTGIGAHAGCLTRAMHAGF